MRLVSFDPFRTLGCPGIRYIKPDHLHTELAQIEAADVVLFPDYADINLLHFAMGKTIFPSVSSYLLGFNKVEMTRAFQSCFPAHVPLTLILPNTAQHQSAILQQMDMPFVAKLPRSTRGEGVFLIEKDADWNNYCAITDILYVQERLAIDRDLRVVWIGSRVVHAYWRVAADGVFHNNIAHGGSIDTQDIPEQAIELVTRVARRFRIDYAGFDVAMIHHHPFLFEFNRRFGMAGVNAANINCGKLIHEYLLEKHDHRNQDLSKKRPQADPPLV